MSNAWVAKNPDEWLAYKKEWAANNADKTAAYRKRWNENNPDYREKNKERLAARAAAYWAANKHSMIPQSLLRAARRRARQKGIECTITLADISVPETCPLLDIRLAVGDGTQNPNSPSLDRIDNTRGYVPGNVWVISYIANVCKGSLTPDQLIQMGDRLKAKIDTLAGGTSPLAGNPGLQAGE